MVEYFDLLIAALIIIAVIVTSHICTMKAYQAGLKHNYELKHDIKPTEKTNPVVQYVENKQEVKQEQQALNTLNEWLYGKENIQ